MKKTISTVLMALIAFVLFNCGKDDPKPGSPTLTVEVEQTLEEGIFKGVVGSPDNGKLNFHFEGKTPAGFESLTLKRYKNELNGQIIALIENTEISGKNISYDLEYELTGEDVCTCKVTFVAELKDSKGNVKTLDVVTIDAHWPLFTDNVVALTNDNDGGLGNGLDYFLSIKFISTNNLTGPDYETIGVSLNDLASNGGYSNVHLLFNRVDTHHFISPNAANENSYIDKELVNPFSSRKATLVKIATTSSLGVKTQSILQNLDEYSAFSMIELFDNLSADESPEMATLGELGGKVVMLKLADGRICLIDNMQFGANIAGFCAINFRFRVVKERPSAEVVQAG
jgi:hypothetical protein